MGYKNSRGSFKDFAYYPKDVRIYTISEDDAEEYTDTLNSLLETLEHDGYFVVSMHTVIEGGVYHTIVDYVPVSCIYLYEDEGGDKDGREQISNSNENTTILEGAEGTEE